MSGSVAPRRALLESGRVHLAGCVFVSWQYPGTERAARCDRGAEAEFCVPSVAGRGQAEKQLFWALTIHMAFNMSVVGETDESISVGS